MTKVKSIILLTVVSVLLAVLAVASFARFPIGIKDYNSFLGSISLGYDIEGGTAYTLSLAKNNTEDIEDIEDVTKVLKARMDSLGYKDYKIVSLKDMSVDDASAYYDIRIIAKTSSNLDSDISAVTAYGEITFYGGTEEDPTTVILDEEEAISKASVMSYEDEDGVTQYNVALKFTSYANNALIDAINVAESSYYLKISLGDTTLLNGSITTDSIQDKTVYLTASTKEDANRMALQLKTGGLKYNYEITSAELITPILGNNTSLFVIIAISAVLLGAIVFFSVKYKGYGLFAGLALVTFILGLISMLVAVPGITISLGGVLGAILASVIAIDGLIIIVKRITEENGLGKTVKAAIKTGYKRSLFPILNTNVIALVIGLALFALTSGTLRNFAIVLSIGVGVSFVATVLISRMFMVIILPLLKNPEKFLKLKKVGE